VTVAVRSPVTGRRPRPPGAGKVGRIGALIVIGLLFVIPLLAFLVSPARCQASNPAVHFTCVNSIDTSAGGFLGLGALSWHNLAYSWREVVGFNNDAFWHWMRTTAIISVGGTALAVVTALPAGYALARLRFRARRALLFVTLLTMVMPNTVLIIPLFLEVNDTGYLGSVWPVIIILGFYPFGVYLGYIHYMTTLPAELVEAARIDGLSEVGIFLRIALPLAKSAVAIIVFFSFVADWTNYFLPLVMFPDTNNSTISVGLQTMIGTSNLYSPTSSGLQDGAGHTLQLYLPQLTMAAVLSMIPILLLFIVSQRYLVRGQTLGAVKG
jgi:multiple sugar transport system permease protein